MCCFSRLLLLPSRAVLDPFAPEILRHERDPGLIPRLSAPEGRDAEGEECIPFRRAYIKKGRLFCDDFFTYKRCPKIALEKSGEIAYCIRLSAMVGSGDHLRCQNLFTQAGLAVIFGMAIGVKVHHMLSELIVPR